LSLSGFLVVSLGRFTLELFLSRGSGVKIEDYYVSLWVQWFERALWKYYNSVCYLFGTLKTWQFYKSTPDKSVNVRVLRGCDFSVDGFAKTLSVDGEYPRSRFLSWNDAVYKFKRYEDSFLEYTGIERHSDTVIGLWNTAIDTSKVAPAQSYL